MERSQKVFTFKQFIDLLFMVEAADNYVLKKSLCQLFFTYTYSQNDVTHRVKKC